MKLDLIRHGKSEANLKGVYAKLDSPLSQEGKEELQGLTYSKPELILSSPALRARQTGEVLYGSYGEIEPRLVEISFGSFEGLTFQEAEKTYGEEIMAWMKDPFQFGPPKGESIEDLLTRLKGLLKDLSKRDKDVTCLTHEGVIRGILALVLDQPTAYFKFKIDNGSKTSLDFSNGYWRILQINYK